MRRLSNYDNEMEKAYRMNLASLRSLQGIKKNLSDLISESKSQILAWESELEEINLRIAQLKTVIEGFENLKKQKWDKNEHTR